MKKIPNEAKEIIRSMYPDHSNAEIAAATGLSVKQIKNYVYKFNESHPTHLMLKKKPSI